MIDTRSAILIFRDCLKIVPKMVEQPNKIIAVRKLIRNQFQKHRYVTQQDKISSLKMNAGKGISNYLIYTIQQQMLNNPNKHAHAFVPESQEQQTQYQTQHDENIERKDEEDIKR